MPIYYIYMHRRASDGLPFYIGKGKGNRFRDKSGRNRHWDRVVKKHGYTVDILHTGLSEEGSKLLEVMEINNKRSMGYPMTNINNGGDGNHGWIPSEDTRNKIREKAIGRKASDSARENMRRSHTGRKHSQESKDKIRYANLRRTPEFNASIGLNRRDNEEFVFLDLDPDGPGFVIATRKYMQEFYGLNASKISDLIFGRRSQHKGWILLNHTPRNPKIRGPRK